MTTYSNLLLVNQFTNGTAFIKVYLLSFAYRRIAYFKVDPDTVSIFELYLTLRQDKSGWSSLVPQFIK